MPPKLLYGWIFACVYADGGSGSGCNNNNTRELGIHLDLDRPYAREELPQQGGSMEVQKGEERGSVRHNSSNHRRLSRVQSKQLDEFYRVNHTVDSVSMFLFSIFKITTAFRVISSLIFEI